MVLILVMEVPLEGVMVVEVVVVVVLVVMEVV